MTDLAPKGQRTSELEESLSAISQSDASASAPSTEAQEALKDQIDDVESVPKGAMKADQNSGGRVMVGETGDLKKMAAEKGR